MLKRIKEKTDAVMSNVFHAYKSGDCELVSELEEKLRILKTGKDYSATDNLSKLSPGSAKIMQLVNEIAASIHENNAYELSKFSLVMKASKIALWDMQIVEGDPVNPNNTFTWSDKFRHMLGYSNEKDFPNVLSSWSDKLHPEDKERTLNDFARHLLDRTGTIPYDIEYRLLKKNGEYGYFHAFGATTRDETGKPLRVAGAVEDISEVKKDALEKETASLRLSLLQKSINIALWDMVVDPQDPTGASNAFWWSDEFRHLLGFESEKDFPNILSSWSERLHPEDKEKTLNAFAAHLNDKTGKTPYNVEYRVRRKTGEYLLLKADGSTLRGEDGTPIRVVGSVEDISIRAERDAAIVEFAREIADISQRIDSIIVSFNDFAKAQEANHVAVADLENNVAETKSIISAIKKIASQSNILGINASIESARAGEAGSGFGVVAGEISTLALESKNSSEQVEAKLQGVNNSVHGIANAIKETTELINKQSTTVAMVRKDLNELNTMYKSIVGKMD